MGQRPLISVIIPVYNRAYCVEKAILSVLNQSFSDLELIIVDDGSTDNLESVLENINDCRIIFIKQANQGVSIARNNGILKGQGTWFAFLDSDDEWLPKKLEIQLKQLEEDKLLWSHTDEIWIRNGVRVNAHKKHAKKGGRIFLDSLPLCMVSPSSVLIHERIFKDKGLFDPTLAVAEDYDLWLRISSSYKISLIEKPLVIKRGGHLDQLSRSFIGMDRFRVRALRKNLDSKLLSEKESEELKKTLKKKCKILANGYKKHNKVIMAKYYEDFLNTFL